MAITANPGSSGTLSRHGALATRLLEVLREEHAALEADDVDALAVTCAAKEQTVQALRAVLAATPSRDARLAALMREAAAANTANAQFAAARLAYTRARLGGLTQAAQMARSAVQSGALYQADGFTGGRLSPRGLYGLA